MMFVNPYGSSGDLFELDSQQDKSSQQESKRFGRRIIDDNYFINEDQESSRSNISDYKQNDILNQLEDSEPKIVAE
jgi:hypothetical protein